MSATNTSKSINEQIDDYCTEKGVQRKGSIYEFEGQSYSSLASVKIAVEESENPKSPPVESPPPAEAVRHKVEKFIVCQCCEKRISRLAAACPNCGEPNNLSQTPPKVTSETAEVDMVVKGGAYGVAILLGLVGFIFLFIAFPIGLVMLIVSGILHSLGGEKKIKGIEGLCVSCGRLVKVPANFIAADCPVCKTRFMNDEGKFVKA